MLFLDTRSLDRKLLPLPAGSEVVVIDSGMPRALASSHYNLRRTECEEAARMLDVPSLRDVVDASAIGLLKHPQVFGAKLTRAGFGRACVALCRRGAGTLVAGQVLSSHNSTKSQARVLLPT